MALGVLWGTIKDERDTKLTIVTFNLNEEDDFHLLSFCITTLSNGLKSLPVPLCHQIRSNTKTKFIIHHSRTLTLASC